MPLEFRFGDAAPRPRCPPAANDNILAPAGPDRDGRILLREALRIFAAHGAGAAQLAHGNAERAFFAGKRCEYRHWLAICRALDRQLVDARVGAPMRPCFPQLRLPA